MAANIKFKPLGPNILVRPTKAETTTKTGVVLVQKDEERPQSGEVVALGTGVIMPDGKISQFAVREGDEVLFKKYGGTEIDLDGEKYLVLTEMDILGIMEK